MLACICSLHQRYSLKYYQKQMLDNMEVTIPVNIKIQDYSRYCSFCWLFLTKFHEDYCSISTEVDKSNVSSCLKLGTCRLYEWIVKVFKLYFLQLNAICIVIPILRVCCLCPHTYKVVGWHEFYSTDNKNSVAHVSFM